MPAQITSPTLAEVEAAKAAHDVAVAALDATRLGTYDRMVAADRAEVAHRRHIQVASAYWNALAGAPTDDTIEQRVYRAADILGERLYPSVSPSNLAWALEEAGLLR